ncbi:MAG: DNA polymerase III subunit alpha [Pseudoflavonifractor sp.]|nr:DNA polymerase III subunit alpha [Alloprevotella sp.]MCM1116097.1 DNA polymerase III subunit alpha [Pseudoflavonifractor sp.]
MTPFVHLHVHSQYSLLDGQASIQALVDKAVADGMPGLAVTDHGNMFGIKEFFNYTNKKNGKTKGAIKDAEARAAEARAAGDEAAAAQADNEAEKLRRQIIKPIFGCEMYVANEDLHTQTDKRDTGRHLIVLAKNKTGYKNLIKLVSQAFTEGFYSHPRTDKQQLASHREGLIIASACLGGELPRLIAAGETEAAKESARWWKETFGDDYYIELQRHRATDPLAPRDVYETQKIVNPVLIDIARELGIKLIATNDVHFVNAEDAEAHDRLICISTGSNFNDPDRMRYTKQEWMKTTAEMNEIFADIPEALSNTLEILDKVETYSIDHGPIMPFFEIPKEFGTEEEYRSRLTEEDLFNEFTRDENGNVVMSDEDARKKIDKLGGYDKLYRIKFEADYLSKLAYEGAKRRYGDPLTPELAERIKFELHIMKTMGFPGYFLIVQDFINAARNKLGVSVGPGRGSAAGSCVAYCLGITQIDPIKYDLLFERFLNPDRISLPDIDIDFDDDGRAVVLRYVTQKYGEEKVAHIITYGTMAAKMAIKDVARVEQLPLSESDRLTKLIPKRMPEVNGKELKPNLSNIYKYVPEFEAELNSQNPLIRETLKYAKALEGNMRNTGVHACGVIICRDAITDWVPVSTAIDKGSNDKSKIIVTQYEGSVIEETGLIKMDFLGLKTLSIIKEAVANIKRTRGIDIDTDAIPIDDEKTYRLYCEGRTTGTFQFESAGMQKYLRELQPSTFEDLIAMNALYRPGPMDYIPDFIARKHGRSPITYDIPEMETYLKDTYGVTVYQEQVMLLSRLLANFTRGESDTLRKAMGKKLIEKMNALKTKFLSGGQANGHDPKVLEKIWADWEKFASYAFNKSHATCYSWVAYQTAYLKANYPAEYMAAILTRNMSDTTKLTGFMEECRKMHIPVKGPDVNESYVTFGVNKKGDIRFGLAAIKGVGEGVVAEIIKARDAGGPFESIYDFVERVPTGAMNRRILEALALAGAFDCFAPDIRRETFFAQTSKGDLFSEAILRYGQLYHNDRQTASMSLFGDDDAATSTAGRPQAPVTTPWADAYRLDKERDLVGLYLSAHPLDPYYLDLNYGCLPLKHFSDEEAAKPEGIPLTFGGMVVAFDKGTSRKGNPFGKLKVEDFSGSHEFMLFERDFYTYAAYCTIGTKVLIRGSYGRRFNSPELRFSISSMQPLDEVKGKLCTGITIRLAAEQLDPALHSLISDAIKSGGQRTDENVDGTVGTFTVKLLEPRSCRWLTLTSQNRLHITRRLTDSLKELDIDFAIDTLKPQ